ncbi:MAG: GNAT family N-acetyltransferase [Pseudomonadota bacterium]
MIAPITAAHLDAVLALNNQHAKETSELDLSGLRDLVGTSFAALQAGEGEAGFLIAVTQDADYDSPNFLWFQERYDTFVYVDRVVVSASHRGEGYARQFYEALFQKARAAGHTAITCEVNVDPPNPASDAFHERMGFLEVGRAELPGRGKTVRYLVKDTSL